MYVLRMTTHDLIKHLSTLPGHLPVMICQEGITFSDDGEVGAGDYLTKIEAVEALYSADDVDRRVVRHRQPAGGTGGAVLLCLSR